MGSPHQRFVIAQTLVTRFPAATAVIVEAQELSINIGSVKTREKLKIQPAKVRPLSEET